MGGGGGIVGTDAEGLRPTEDGIITVMIAPLKRCRRSKLAKTRRFLDTKLLDTKLFDSCWG